MLGVQPHHHHHHHRHNRQGQASSIPTIVRSLTILIVVLIIFGSLPTGSRSSPETSTWTGGRGRAMGRTRPASVDLGAARGGLAPERPDLLRTVGERPVLGGRAQRLVGRGERSVPSGLGGFVQMVHQDFGLFFGPGIS